MVHDSDDEYIIFGESTATKCVYWFPSVVIEIFGWKQLREPTAADVPRNMEVNEKRGFLEMCGLVDCTHWAWKNIKNLIHYKSCALSRSLLGENNRKKKFGHGNNCDKGFVDMACIHRDSWIFEWYQCAWSFSSHDELSARHCPTHKILSQQPIVSYMKELHDVLAILAPIATLTNIPWTKMGDWLLMTLSKATWFWQFDHFHKYRIHINHIRLQTP